MPLQWHNQIWQSLEDGAGKRCWECGAMTEFVIHFVKPVPFHSLVRSLAW